MSPDTQDTEGRFHPWENDPLKRSLKSSSELLEGTSESQVGDVSRDSVMPPVQKRKLDPLPKKHRHLRKVVRTKRKRKRKSKRKEKVETPHPGILPASLVRPQNEEDEVVDNKLTLLSAKEDGPDLPNKERLQSQQDEDTCVMHQEYPIQPCELSVSQELRPSSPAETSLASPPLCFGRFISCVCQTFSRSRKRKSGRESTKQAEGGGDAKAPRPGLLRVLGKNRVEPH